MQDAVQALWASLLLPALCIGILAGVSMLWLEHMTRD